MRLPHLELFLQGQLSSFTQDLQAHFSQQQEAAFK
jgi:hypothetical protein